jgi:hypothetical protein
MTAKDPLLAALTDARQRKERADHEIRLLLAYARCLVTPRPYRLADLAEASGMSISGVRVAYREAEIRHMAERLAAANWQHAQDAIATLLAIEPQASNRDIAAS